jgi:hypothetical protein
MSEVTINEAQKRALERLWFIYGNRGSKHTDLNHKYIQGFVQYNEDREEALLSADFSAYLATGRNIDKIKLTQECIDAVKAALEENM